MQCVRAVRKETGGAGNHRRLEQQLTRHRTAFTFSIVK